MVQSFGRSHRIKFIEGGDNNKNRNRILVDDNLIDVLYKMAASDTQIILTWFYP